MEFACGFLCAEASSEFKAALSAELAAEFAVTCEFAKEFASAPEAAVLLLKFTVPLCALSAAEICAEFAAFRYFFSSEFEILPI